MSARSLPVSIWYRTLGAGLLCALLGTPAAAGPTAAQQEAMARLWDRAMLEQSILLTCGATSQEIDKAARKYWEGTRKQALALMEAKGWPQAELTHLAQISPPDQLRMPDATTFGEVLAFCHDYADWTELARSQQFLPLVDEIAALLAEPQP